MQPFEVAYLCSMKIKWYLLLIVMLVVGTSRAQLKDTTLWQSSTQFNKTRFNAYAYGAGGAAVASLLGLYTIWYADYPQSAFHFVNDNQNWGGMDKLGHATTTYWLGHHSYGMLKWSGVSEHKAIWYGGLSGFTYMAAIEVMDGLSAEWGFSWGDFAFNTAGSALFIGQQYAWGQQRILPKFSTHATKYAAYRPDLLGNGWQEQWLKDYNGQTYWLSTSPGMYGVDWWPSWLCLSAGYSIDGYVSADGSNTNNPQFRAQKQFYFSLDLDLRQIKTKSAFLKAVFNTLNFVKIPAPAVEFNTQIGGTKLHGLYF